MGNVRLVQPTDTTQEEFGQAMIELAEMLSASNALLGEKTALLRQVSKCYSLHSDHVMAILAELRTVAADITDKFTPAPDSADSADSADTADTGADTHTT